MTTCQDKITVNKRFGWISDPLVLKIEEELLEYVNTSVDYLDDLWKSGKISSKDFREIVLKYEDQYKVYKKTFKETFGYPLTVTESLSSFVKYFEKAAKNNSDEYSYAFIVEEDDEW